MFNFILANCNIFGAALIACAVYFLMNYFKVALKAVTGKIVEFISTKKKKNETHALRRSVNFFSGLVYAVGIGMLIAYALGALLAHFELAQLSVWSGSVAGMIAVIAYLGKKRIDAAKALDEIPKDCEPSATCIVGSAIDSYLNGIGATLDVATAKVIADAMKSMIPQVEDTSTAEEDAKKQQAEALAGGLANMLNGFKS